MYTVKKVTFAALAFALMVGATVSAADTRQEARAALSRDRAQQLALRHVNGGRIVDSEFNNRWFRDNDYEFTVVDDTNRYDISVDAETGEIINVKQEAIFEDELSDRDRQRARGAVVTPEQARQIAMERAPNSLIVEMKRKFDDDSVVYDIEMLGATTEVDMRVDGMTGRILSYDEDRLEDGDMRFRNRRAQDRALNRSLNRAQDRVDQSVNRSRNQIDQSLNRSLDRSGDRLNQSLNRTGDRLNDTLNRAGDRIDEALDRTGDRLERSRDRLDQSIDRSLNRNADALETNARW